MELRRTLLATSLSLLFPAVLLAPSLAQAHGHISAPKSRHLMCRDQGTATEGCKAYQSEGNPGIYEAGGHTGKGGRDYLNATPQGQICSTNYGAANRGINVLVKNGDWPVTAMTAHNGEVDLEYNFTAYHGTDHVAFYITKQNYDPGKTLSVNDFELLCREDGELPPDNGGRSGTRKFSHCKLPSNQSGRHLIWATWPVSAQHGTGEVFTNCADVVINNDQNTNPGSGWETVNPDGVNANEDLKTGATATFRLFDSARNGIIAYEKTITAATNMAKAQWLYQLANTVNGDTNLVRVGALVNNDITLPTGKTHYDVFSKNGKKYGTAIVIENNNVEEPGNGGGETEKLPPVIQLKSQHITVDQQGENAGYAMDASQTLYAGKYRWEIIAGDNTFQLQKTAGGPTYYATPLEGEDLHTVRAWVKGGSTGTATYRLTVTNDYGKASKDITVTVNAANAGGGKGIPAWKATNYPTKCTKVSHKGQVWQNQWWAGAGEEPGPIGQWGITWQPIGAAGNQCK
ncbi:lytic polysaccharide monooxygenase [Pantoea sp. At-9b]|uniref:lytic polysaccharide monooxygenase n=1 Tax=Pantoea sp. (strain At-9b) TaxID=592316 RepID=UPI0001B3E22E|nr:lytic polysaccharide monooxygenase [Pantoea sp. At-9b]ADU70603.1 chitin-binding domain 3 protein [Pantoea sp. At-9b]